MREKCEDRKKRNKNWNLKKIDYEENSIMNRNFTEGITDIVAKIKDDSGFAVTIGGGGILAGSILIFILSPILISVSGLIAALAITIISTSSILFILAILGKNGNAIKPLIYLFVIGQGLTILSQILLIISTASIGIGIVVAILGSYLLFTNFNKLKDDIKENLK